MRDFGQSDPATRYVDGAGFPSNAPLVQIPGTGVIWKICQTQQAHNDDDDHDHHDHHDHDDHDHDK